MNLEEAKIYVQTLKWVEAKSYSDTFPHKYTTRTRVDDEYKFEEFLWCIRDNGILKTFYTKQYIYLELDGYEYWEMGRPIKAVQVLNRAIINDAASYRNPKPSVTEQDRLKAMLNKRDCVLQTILNKQERTEQEQSIVTFLMNTERRIHGGGKNIIDHSNQKIKYEETTTR
jgi:hypothetical protein